MVELSDYARKAARMGDCALARQFAEHVRKLDPDRHPSLVGDPLLAGCVEPAAGVSVRRGYRSPNAALGLSLGTTLGGAGPVAAAIAIESERGCGDTENCEVYLRIAAGLAIVGGLGFLAGPTLGHAYSGRTLNPGLAYRITGGAIMVLGGCWPRGALASREGPVRTAPTSWADCWWSAA